MINPFKKKDEPEVQPKASPLPTPDYQKMMRVMTGDSKGNALNKLIASDASNAIKSSNANPFNLSVMDVMGHWEEAKDEQDIIRFFLNGRRGPGTDEIEGGYRINKMAEDFKMTILYSDAFKAWTILGSPGGGGAPSTLTEGDRK